MTATANTAYCPILLDYLGPYLVHGSMGPHESTPQMASQTVQPFSQSPSWADYVVTMSVAIAHI